MQAAERLPVRSVGDLEIIEFEIFEKAPDGETASGFYGVNVHKVREVIKSPPFITRAGKDHPAVEGVIDLRGEVIPVINLPKWLGKYDPGFKYERIIIVEFNFLRAGIMVNRVHRIHHVPYENYTPPAPFMRSGTEISATGVIRNEGKILWMLDFEKLLADIDPEALTDGIELHPSPASQKRTVLVVEDSAAVRSVLRQAFSQGGFSFLEALNGMEALELLEGLHRKAEQEGSRLSTLVNAVVTDVEMPLMDGLRLVQTLKRDSRFKELPAIIYSSISSNERMDAWREMGADACIGKPELALLIEKIREMTLF